MTLSKRKSEIELDLAIIFLLRACDLTCFLVIHYDPFLFTIGGKDCFGIYKILKGFSRFVLNANVQVRKIYPLITIWKNNQK